MDAISEERIDKRVIKHDKPMFVDKIELKLLRIPIGGRQTSLNFSRLLLSLSLGLLNALKLFSNYLVPISHVY